MSGPIEALGVRAAGATDPGLQREVNEDRFHVDVARGLFIVDRRRRRPGGRRQGGRHRGDHAEGPARARDRSARVAAARSHHRRQQRDPSPRRPPARVERHGLRAHRRRRRRGSVAIVGHVGDTRLYKLRRGRIEKVTRDHSPVGEREDARELSELEAMQHPRRNEVYRDVGSEPHEPADPDFIDIQEVPFEPDAALLLCSDGLTDLVDSSAIAAIVSRWAGRPQMVVDALIDGGQRRRRQGQRHGRLRRGRAVRAPAFGARPPAIGRLGDSPRRLNRGDAGAVARAGTPCRFGQHHPDCRP